MYNIDAQLDVLFDTIDYYLLTNRFDIVDSILFLLPIEKTCPDLLLGYLTITLSAKSQLKNRKKFYSDVDKHFQTLDLKENLLSGLQ